MTKSNSLISILFVLVLFVISCKEPLQEPQVMHNVKYGNHDRNIMDVYLPKGRNAETPFIVLIHPGAWMSGEKEILTRMADSLYQNGIAVANINTRFVSDSTDVNVMFDDIAGVVQFCKEQSKIWNTRNNHFAIGGSSSGGHLALAYAYTKAANQDIAAIIAFAAPVNVADASWLRAMVDTDIKEKVEWLCGAKYELGTLPDSSFYRNSPINFIKNIPTLMVHGNEDDIIPYTQAQQMIQALQNQNVPNKLFTLENKGHVVGYQDPPVFAKVVQEMVTWLEQYK